MGWTSFNKREGLSVKDWFMRNDWEGYGWGEKFEVLDCAIVNVRELYGAVKIKESGKVFAAIFLLDFSRNDGHNFAYKDMDESCGPYYHNCPERILKLLTPIESEYAIKWRERCWAAINKKKSSSKIEDGTIIKFASALNFTNGFKGDIFRVNKDGRKVSFTPPGRYGNYTISKWKERDFVILTTEELQDIVQARQADREAVTRDVI